ncbi:hypothetical protein K3148_07865 [Qipengyuania aurantiaca]|uniref:Uncharacterized protein n=1 Tax=Qipengyuania aurantiaca TaxID=2867233 RepID=A0ABX8ZIF4_9SPHN|nr:hypothetical protein [Qipengyuania aurantiaca]QZD88780.1 hypothetical protein K3148_07865 [Qipengyuania aurantiaca]
MGGKDSSRAVTEDSAADEAAMPNGTVEDFFEARKPSKVGRAAYLVFEFPDGVRGGSGKIQGVGDWPIRSAYSTPLTAEYWRDFASIFTNCGAQNPWFEPNWSHRTFVVVDGSPRNAEVVECVRKSLSLHFNVGAGIADPEDGLGVFGLVDRSRGTPN